MFAHKKEIKITILFLLLSLKTYSGKMSENEPNWRKAMLADQNGFYEFCIHSGPWSQIGFFCSSIIFCILRKCCGHWKCWERGEFGFVIYTTEV